jgi:tRNA wybutosine-synthesizing protein 1
MIKNGWNKINESLELINSLSCRTLIRLTAVKNININEQYLNEYFELIKKANPNFFEIKGFTLQAKALLIKERLKSEETLQHYFPDFTFLEDLALKFQELSGFPLIYKNQASRDFLFAVNWDKDKDPIITNL